MDISKNYDLLEHAMRRLGKFGKLFVDYKGCGRGAMGRAGGISLEKEVLMMPELTDVDGGVWIPVNADALHELVDRYICLKAREDNTVEVPKYCRECPYTNTCPAPHYLADECKYK